MLRTNNLGHLGVILDGNRRWAKAKGMSPWQGHWAGADKAEEFLDWCLELGIPEVSMYVLSSENLEKRSGKELQEIFKVLLERARKLMNDAKIRKYEIKVRFCGSFYTLPSSLVNAFQRLMRRTRKHRKRVLNVLVNYGSQWELRRTIAKVVKLAMEKRIQITPNFIQKNLMVGRPLDLIIRTGGEHRLSNFLLWQAAYAEIYFTDTLWPDFSKGEFLDIIDWFNHRQRRFGE
jgi:undecaprenyl diphosphate synthase